VVLGHALLASWYAGLGVAALGGLGSVLDWRVILGTAFGGLGTVVLLANRYRLALRLAQPTLEKLLRTLRRYNLARPVGRLSGLDSRIEVFPTVLLALPDPDLADAAAEVTRTRSELSLYERPEDGTTAVEVEE
jgi:hypothetical protein